MVDMALVERMLEVVRAIPAGCVATYTEVAARAGSASPRLAGWVLSNFADETVPWHRVLRANGTPAPHLTAQQLQRLAAEGVPAQDGRVNLRRYRWAPE